VRADRSDPKLQMFVVLDCEEPVGFLQ